MCFYEQLCHSIYRNCNKGKIAMNGGEAIVEGLALANVTHVFGLLGSTTLELYDALYEHQSINYVGVRDERAGTHMADAMGRISGQPGIVLAGQAGPGSANMVTGLAQAMLAYSPVVAITGLAATNHLGRDTFQEIDQQALFSPITKRTMSVPSAERIPEFLKEAFRIAMAGRKGPVVIQIPRDLFASEITGEIKNPVDCPIESLGTTSSEGIASVCSLIRKAKAPVIIAGGGVKHGKSSEILGQLAKRLVIPVTASAGHADVLPTDHPMFFGQVGPRGNDVASKLTRDADLIIALGTRLGFNTTFYTYNDISPNAKIIQVDISEEAVGRYFPISIGVVGDVGLVIKAIDEGLKNFNEVPILWKEKIGSACDQRKLLWKNRELKGVSESLPLSPERIFKEIRDVLPRNSIVTLDAGTLCLQATDQLKYFQTPALLTPLDFGLVGFSFAAGLGAKAAAPERPVITLMGDGGFAMTMAEITTSVRHGLNTVSIVLDNGCWGAEKAYQRDYYNGRFIGCDITNPPFDKVAELCGAAGYAVSEAGQLSDALSLALSTDKTSIIHVKVDPNSMVSFRRDSFQHRVSQTL